MKKKVLFNLGWKLKENGRSKEKENYQKYIFLC